MSGYPVVPPDQVPGVGVSDEILDLTTTPVKKLFVSGLLALSIAYISIATPAGTIIYVVFDALDDADAATKLGTAGSRELIMLGERRQWQFDDISPCYRVDFASNVASETGDTITQLSGKVQ